MSGEDFYITLPSNSSAKFYPDNTIANYRTKLPRSIHFNIPYEVALTEIHYPLSWDQYIDEDSVVTERYRDGTGATELRKFIMPVGRYRSLEHLTEDITRRFKESKHPTNERKHILTYDPVINRVTVYAAYPSELMFRGGLARMLGFKHATYTRIAALTVAPHPADLQAGVYSMYVYSDVVQHQTVGDHHVQLMRAVHIDDSSKKFVTTVFARPHYLRVSKDHLDSIEVSVKTDQNENVRFTYGKVVVVLHFRPVKYT